MSETVSERDCELAAKKKMENGKWKWKVGNGMLECWNVVKWKMECENFSFAHFSVFDARSTVVPKLQNFFEIAKLQS